MSIVREPFQIIYERHFSEIYNYVYGQMLHRERTEDLVSEIFIKAMTHYGDYDPEKASVRTWLTRIARNAVIDEFRKNALRNHQSLDDEENPVEPSYEDDYGIDQEDARMEVCRLFEKLKPDERELLAMIYFQHMKNEEIGSVLGINAKAVSERHRRLLKKCRKLL